MASFRQAFTASSGVKLELTLDRREYLAGEAPRVTIAAFNPTQDSLLVLNPFDIREACIDLSTRSVEDGEWWSQVPEGPCEGWAIPAPTLALGPGERVEKELPSAESSLKPRSPRINAGHYRMSFCYRNRFASCAHAEFDVVEPIFRGSAAVMLAEPNRVTNPRTGVETQYPRYIHAFLLEYGGKRYLGLARKPQEQSRVLLNLDQKLDHGNANEIAGFDRIAEAGMEANSLQLEADAQENITVTWNESSQAKSYRVSSDRTRLESCQASPVPPVQISIDPPTKTLGVSESKHFIVGIAGTSNTAVNWSIALGPGAPSGAEPGTISAEGVYEAPHSIPSPYTVIVTAQSQADRTKSTSAIATLAPRWWSAARRMTIMRMESGAGFTACGPAFQRVPPAEARRQGVPSMGRISLDERSQSEPMTATVAEAQGVGARRSRKKREANPRP
jgi:hypothetical protein